MRVKQRNLIRGKRGKDVGVKQRNLIRGKDVKVKVKEKVKDVRI